MKNEIPNITSLRFFLAVLVIIYHVPQFFQNRDLPFYNDLPIFNKGSEAVYMFFSLSGFLIIKQLFDEKITTGEINLKNFYIRRILRILPLYYLVAFLGLLYYNFILPYFGLKVDSNYNFLAAILLLFTFFANIFATYQPGGILEILWSISIEEQFYIIIAPTLLCLKKKYIFIFLLLFTIIYIIVYCFSELNFFSKYNMMFYYFSFAGLCSIAKEKFRLLNIDIFRNFIYLATFIYFTTNIFSGFFTEQYYQIFSMILFGCFLTVITQKSISFCQNKILIYLGKISYGIYMYHAIAMQIIGLLIIKILRILKLNSIFAIFLEYFLVISLTILLSHFSFKFFEKYFLNLKKKYY